MRERWSSSIGFILASIGSAVGLGNIWRFPYIVGSNGGGAFLIPYLIAVFLFGLPLMILEFALGRNSRKSIIPTFTSIKRSFRFIGFFLVLVNGMILSYYLVIMGWVFAYFLFFILGYTLSFSQFINSYYSLIFFFISSAITFFVVRSGIRGGIERLCKILIPVLFAMLFFLLIFALSLPNGVKGVEFYLNPDFIALFNPFVWTSAFGQAFFSLSVGTGIMLTYGSYMGEERLVRSSFAITISDLVIAFLAGFVIFPIVFAFGFDPAAGVQLAFVILVEIFQIMPLGLIFGAMFFLLLFFAAVTSSISMFEVLVASLMDSRGMDRGRASILLILIIILLGLPSALSYSKQGFEIFGLPYLDAMDIAFGTLGIIVAGLLLNIAVVWFWDLRVIMKQVELSAKFEKIFRGLMKYFIPLILLITLLTRIALMTT